jgi:hypothetical protein
MSGLRKNTKSFNIESMCIYIRLNLIICLTLRATAIIIAGWNPKPDCQWTVDKRAQNVDEVFFLNNLCLLPEQITKTRLSIL